MFASGRCDLAPDKNSCEGLYARQQLYAYVKAGKVIYDGHAAAACLDFYGTADCNLSDETSSAHISPLQSCRETVKGTVGTGGACVATGPSRWCRTQPPAEGRLDNPRIQSRAGGSVGSRRALRARW